MVPHKGRGENKVALVAIGGLAIVGTASAGHASTVSYYIDQTNINTAPMVDGVDYAKVTINDSTANKITFTVSLLPGVFTPGSNFGIDGFAFNVNGTDPLQDSGTVAGQWSLPTGWSGNLPPPQNQFDGFGRYDVAVNGTGSSRVSTLTFSLYNTGLTDASFAKLSSGTANEGNTYFALSIAGFSGPGGTTSGYFGGSTLAPVPVPAALPLLLSGFGLLGSALRRRRLEV